ncbi:MAG TPA: WD40 repeat domain-containing protein, partial [Solirubrobacterales bacterium]|nr:WD40 repeat domain-containing protein [Solirubrobacterales bacterium]
MRARGLSPGHWLLALAVVIAAGVLGIVLQASGDTSRRAAAEGAMTLAPRYLADRPGDAARLALAGNHLDPSVATELAMLSVAVDSAGIERVVDGGPARVTAAIRTAHFLVTADEKRVLRVWRPHNGALLGALRVQERIVALADTPAAPLVAAADASGRLSLIDLADPHRPKLRRLPVPGGDGPRLALAFSNEAVEIVTVSRAGLVERFDAMTGSALDRWSLREVEGAVPWEGGSGALRLVAASFDSQPYGAGERLLVGLPDGAVVRVELKPKRGRTMIPAGFAPGEITAVAEVPHGHGVAAAARGGYMARESGEVPPIVRRGAEATGVAFDAGDALWVGNREGVGQQPTLSYGAELDFAGRPAAALTAGVGGVVAIGPEGTVSLLGDSNSGLGLPNAPSSSFAAFGPDGRLLITEGGEYAYRLVALKPGHGREYGQVVPNPELRSYEPDPDWWPEEGGFSVEAGAIGDELAVAGGQDPTGTAVVLAWDAESGSPLRRLPLATGGVETLEPSVVSEVLLLSDKHLVAAYSTVQQLIAIWSTDTWEQVAAVPVGAIGSMALRPDESEIVAIGGSDEESGGGKELVFVDVDAGHATEISHPGVTDAAWSADGNWLAVVDAGGALRIMSPDGEDEVRAPIQLEDEPLALAWRPDGEEIAVASRESVVLVDPLTGTVSPPLPNPSFATVHHLDWSADGRFLATTGSELREDGEAYEPAPVQLWTVGEARLRRRMCQLAGSPSGTREWTRLAGAGVPQPPCRVPASRPNGDPGEAAGELEDVDLIFRRGNDLFAADLGGNAARVGRVPSEGYPQISVSWDPDAVAWQAQSEIGMLGLGSRQVFEWTCVCRGAALRGGELVALG